MDHAPNPYDDQPFVPPQREPGERRSWSWKVPRLGIAAGLVVILGLAGTGAAFAFGGSGFGGSGSSSGAAAASTTTTTAPSSTTPTTMPDKGPRFSHGFGGFGGFGPGGGAAGFGGRVVHGQSTVQTPSGYKTVLQQVGTVVDVSSTSIELKSSDGYDHIYTVTPTTLVNSQADGIATVAEGDQVSLQGVQQSGTDTATDIVDITKIGSSHDGFGFTPRQPKGPMGQSPSTAPPGATSGTNVKVED